MAGGETAGQSAAAGGERELERLLREARREAQEARGEAGAALREVDRYAEVGPGLGRIVAL
jgi:hypothetical protein